VLRFVAFFAIAIATASANELKQTRESDSQFVGSIGCKSSSCHGGAGEKRSQYITWLQRDFHTHAYAILLDARSARIAEALNIPEAQSSARCTVCHSPFQSVPQTRLATTAHPDEGVSCETCHGASEPWLRGHTRKDWTYAMRVSAGMRDLRNLYVRANTCVACHQNVDNDILKAGHPTLVFELDSQSVKEPPHWHDDNSWNGLRLWLIGQAVALREAAWRSETESESTSDSRETSDALSWLLMRTTEIDHSLPQITSGMLKLLSAAQNGADELARRVPNWNPGVDSTMSILRALADSGSEFVASNQTSANALFYRARRVSLAVERLSVAINSNGGALKIDHELDALREDVRYRENFDAAKFAEHLRALRAKL
jgi:hypothetical protein